MPVGISETYSICGTKSYFSPEQLRNKGYDKMIDYWMYGCILYEMFTGHPPFQNSNQMVLFEMIKNVKLVNRVATEHEAHPGPGSKGLREKNARKRCMTVVTAAKETVGEQWDSGSEGPPVLFLD